MQRRMRASAERDGTAAAVGAKRPPGAESRRAARTEFTPYTGARAAHSAAARDARRARSAPRQASSSRDATCTGGELQSGRGAAGRLAALQGLDLLMQRRI